MGARGSLPVIAVFLLAMTSSALAGFTSFVYVYSGDFNLAIPGDPAASRGWMQDAVVTVPDHVLICDLNVSVTIRHTCAFDLQLFVEGPQGQIVLLSKSDPLEGYYEGQDYASTVFDDEAGIGIEEGDPPFTGSFRPLAPLAVFDGRDAYGPWALRAYDAYYVHTGYLEFFALIVTVSSPDVPVAVPAPAAGGLALLGLILIRRRVGKAARVRPAGGA